MPAPPLPIICDNCGRVSAAQNLISISGGASAVLSGNLTTCPKCGRPARIADATITSSVGKVQVTTRGLTPAQINEFAELIGRDIEWLRVEKPEAFKSVVKLADHATKGEISEEEAAAKIAAQLPEQSAAAVKELGARGSLKAVLRGAILAGKLATWAAPILSAGVTVYDRIYPALPPQTIVAAPPSPPITINNHNTFINPGALENTGGIMRAPVVKREQVRRLKQMERQRKKRADAIGHEKAKTKPKPKPRRES